MPIRKYSKAPISKSTSDEESFTFDKAPKEEITIGNVTTGVKNDVRELLTTSKLASLLIPLILVSIGAFILYGQLKPAAEQRLKEATGYYDQGTVTLVEGDFLSAREQYLSNPGSEYFQSLTNQALSQKVLKEDPVSNNYKNTFYITVDSLGLNRLAVTPNVESGVEEVYQSVLQSTLAHFKGTGLPISDVENNIVIYGHSASGDYFSRTGDKVAAFSRLSELQIGDEVKVEMDGKTFKYKISKSKIVEPNDVSIINGSSDKQTLTLFTCYPNGSNGKRYVAVAKPIET